MAGSRRSDWPTWWEWELELSPHVLERMLHRRFSEVDILVMPSIAMNLREDQEPGQWVVETPHESRNWEVIVEPDLADHLPVVITACSVESP